MCMTIDPANLDKTILLAHEVEVDGKTLNVIGYQNNATNKSYPRRPNAMVLPFPAAELMTQDNCIDMTGHERLFKEYQGLMIARTRSLNLSKGRERGVDSLSVFDSGSYTVVLAADAQDIPSAINQVPENKRPRLHPELFEALGMWYPGWSVALCCWDGAIEAEPMVWWYRPLPEFRDKHFLPGLDGHDGGVPDPARDSVPVDHTIVVGGPVVDGKRENAAYLLRDVPDELRRWLPSHVYGDMLPQSGGTMQMRNGDWVLPKSGWTSGNMRQRVREQRHRPPGFSP